MMRVFEGMLIDGLICRYCCSRVSGWEVPFLPLSACDKRQANEQRKNEVLEIKFAAFTTYVEMR
jgi:hypothetical protein